MKRAYLRWLTAVWVLGILIPQALAQSDSPAMFRQAENILHSPGGNSYLRFSPKNYLNATSWKTSLASSLGMEGQLDFRLVSQYRDPSGELHARFQPLLRGVPIASEQVIVHQENGKVFGLQFRASTLKLQHLGRALNPSAEGLQSKDAALATAIHDSPAKCYAWDVAPAQNPWPQGELVWLPVGEQLRLCWRFDIYRYEPFQREWVFVDIEENRVLSRWNRLHHVDVPAQANTIYDGLQGITTDSLGPGRYRLQAANRGQGIFTYDLRNATNTQQFWDIENNSRNWDAQNDRDKAGWSAHFAAEQTFDYFYQIWNRNSFDNNGAAVVSYVHFGQGIPNAIWNGQAMIFGDGDGQSSFPFVSPDIVAHEFVHGVTDHSAGLLYSGESGALNETFSDVFGVLAESWIRQTPPNWTFGDELNSQGGVRSMSDPQRFNHPDTYQELFWYTGLADNGGVHTNCGVGNYWFYLLAEGGQGVNDLGEFYHIRKVGIDTAAAIAYRTLMVYLTPTSDFADARTWSIQAAEDLYGNCSKAARSVAEAWQAVGVGAGYAGTVQARYLPSETVLCDTPAAVRFLNQSQNAASYAWDFGDGSTASQTHPQHSYAQPGIYTVRLVASGAGACNTQDTLLQTITVQANTPASAINCQPASQQTDPGKGIFQVRLHTMAYSSGGSPEGYQDLSCSHRVQLEQGRAYPLSVSTGSDTVESVTVWIDWNADGDFADAHERVFTSQALLVHRDSLIVPAAAVSGQALRMRVRSEAQGNISVPCQQPVLGQVEDFGVIVQPRAVAPSAAFRADRRVAGVGERVFLEDRSLGAPDSWRWDLPGAIPSSGVFDSLGVEYAAPGRYGVKLNVSNAQGADSVEITDFFNILSVYQLATDTFASDSSGILYDDGGKDNNYSDGSDWIFTIAPPCARWVELSFMHFDIEQCCDRLVLYDGADTTAPVLLVSSGNSLPPTVRSSSGHLTIRFQSSLSGNRAGFCATWHTESVPNNPPVAAFAFAPASLPLNSSIRFEDQSSGNPRSWFWDFGDGTLDTGQVVQHAFTTSGQVSVQLIVDNCTGRDTVSQNLIIQAAPQFSMNPDSLFATLTVCDDTLSQYVTLYNTGQGDLVIRGTELPKDPSQLDSVRTRFNRNFLSIISMIPSRYNFSGGAFGTDIADGGRDMFDNGNILSTNLGGPLFYFDNFILPSSAFGPQGQYLTRKVPGLFFMAADLDGISRFSVSGGLGADGSGKVDGSSLFLNKKGVGYRLFIKRVYDAGDPSVNHIFLLEDRLGISQVFPQNSDQDDHDIRGLGDSRRLYYLMFGAENGRYINDSVMFQLADYFLDVISPGPDYLKFSPDSATVQPGDSVRVLVQQMGAGLSNGRYETDILIQTNDPSIPDTILPCTLELNGSAEITLSADSLDFGAIPLRGTASLGLNLTNSGCDSLIIYSIGIDSTAFSIGGNTGFLLPGQNDSLEVHFSPVQLRNYHANCTIQTNVDTIIIPLKGVGTPSPQAAWQPDSLSLSFQTCFDSTSIAVTLHNRGSAPLQWQANQYKQSLSILALTYGADLNNEYANTIQALRDEGVQFNLTASGTDAPDSLRQLLQGIDVLLLPEAETGFLSVWQSFQPVISAYIQGGGKAVGLASIAGGSEPLFSSGLVSGQFRGATSGQLTVDRPEEALAQALPSSFQAPQNSAMLAISNAGYVSVASGMVGQNQYSVAGYRREGEGLIAIIGMDFDQRSPEADRLLANAVRWVGNGGLVSWIPMAGAIQNIPPGDSASILVPVTAKDLMEGAYLGEVQLQSNDPVFPEIRIPVRLEINGQEALGLSDSCLDFGQLGRYRVQEDSLFLENIGCDSLLFDSLAIRGTAFSTSDSLPGVLLPGERDTLIIAFEPTAVQQYNDSLWIYSSAGDSLICLRGEGMPVPQTSLSEDSLGIQVTTCTDTSRYSVWLHNTGPVATPFRAFAGRGRGKTDILVVMDQFPWGFDMVSWLGQRLSYPVSTISSNGLDSHDLGTYGWIIFVGDQPNTYYNCLLRNEPRLEQFVQSGGLLQLHLATRGASLRLLGGLSSRDGFRETSNDIVSAGHPVVQGLGSPLQGNMANHGYFSNLPSQAQVLTQTSLSRLPTTVVFGLGRGEVLATTMTWEYLHNQTALGSQPLLSQATAWIAAENGASPPWLTILPDSGSLAANDSVRIELNVHPSGMNSGQYQTTVAVRSEDPLNPLRTLVLELDLQGQPAMTLQDSCILFSDTRETTRSSDTIPISNPGCDTLMVVGSLGGTGFSLEEDTVMVPAGDESWMIVHFEPTSPGQFRDTLLLSTSVGDSIICLEGTGLGTARWQWSQDTLQLRMKICDDSTEVFVDLLSTGNADLEYRMPGDPQADSLNILALVHGSDTTTTAWSRMRQLMQQRFPRHRWQSTAANDNVQLRQRLEEIDVVIVPPLDQGGVAVWNSLGPGLQQFVAAGGSLIWCGSGYLQASPLFNSGLISGSYGGRLSAGNFVLTTNPLDVVTQGFPDTISIAQTAYYLDAPLQNLLAFNQGQSSYSVLAYRQLGAGKVFWMGAGMENADIWLDSAFTNAVLWAGGYLPRTWWESGGQGTIAVGSKQQQRIVVRSAGLLSGEYEASLQVQTNHPDSAIARLHLQLELVDEPCAEIAYDSLDVCDGEVRFEAVGQQPGDTQEWYFDGRDTLRGLATVYTFPLSGPHEVTLVTIKDGVTDTLRISVVIPAPLAASFAYRGDLLAGEPVQFIADSTAPARYMWDFGDGSQGDFSQIQHTYSASGQYQVMLMLEDSLGCKADTSQVLMIDFGVGNEVLEDDFLLEVYPNPFEDRVWLKWEGLGRTAGVELLDMHGARLKHFLLTEHEPVLDLRELAAGVYVLRIELGGRTFLRRIVKH